MDVPILDSSFYPIPYRGATRPLTVISEKKKMPKLPSEVLRRLFRYFSLRELLEVSVVCRQWNVVSSDNALWRSLSRVHFPQYPYIKDKPATHRENNNGDSDDSDNEGSKDPDKAEEVSEWSIKESQQTGKSKWKLEFTYRYLTRRNWLAGNWRVRQFPQFTPPSSNSSNSTNGNKKKRRKPIKKRTKRRPSEDDFNSSASESESDMNGTGAKVSSVSLSSSETTIIYETGRIDTYSITHSQIYLDERMELARKVEGVCVGVMFNSDWVLMYQKPRLIRLVPRNSVVTYKHPSNNSNASATNANNSNNSNENNKEIVIVFEGFNSKCTQLTKRYLIITSNSGLIRIYTLPKPQNYNNFDELEYKEMQIDLQNGTKKLLTLRQSPLNHKWMHIFTYDYLDMHTINYRTGEPIESRSLLNERLPYFHTIGDLSNNVILYHSQTVTLLDLKSLRVMKQLQGVESTADDECIQNEHGLAIVRHDEHTDMTRAEYYSLETGNKIFEVDCQFAGVNIKYVTISPRYLIDCSSSNIILYDFTPSS